MFKQKLSKKSIVFIVISLLLMTFGLYKGVQYYMYHEKVNNLYRHGFRLLEEQIATYIVDHYSGISKIEFSPIFIDGDGVYTMRTAYVVPIIYDTFGRRAELGGEIDNFLHPKYGLLNYLDLSFNSSGNELIELSGQNEEQTIIVLPHEPLPRDAIWETNADIDDNISDLIKYNQVEGIEQSKSGSKQAKIIYNTELVKRSD